MVENCEQSADTVAHNLIALLEAAGNERVSAEVSRRNGMRRRKIRGRPCGNGKSMVISSFLAMFVKHFINLVYFVQVLGYNKIAHYLRAEFSQYAINAAVVGIFKQNSQLPAGAPAAVAGCCLVAEGVMKIVEAGPTLPSWRFFKGCCFVL